MFEKLHRIGRALNDGGRSEIGSVISRLSEVCHSGAEQAARRRGGTALAASANGSGVMCRTIEAGAKCGMTALITMMVCACAKDPPKPIEDNIFPADYRAQIVALLRRQVDNPNNILDAYVAEPVLKTSQGTSRYIVCVRFNAKDRGGNYRGSKDVAAYFYAGKINQIADASAELCGNAVFQPFPELQRQS
jgi:hypothetical protein